MSIFSASSHDSLPPATPSPRAPALPHSPSSGSLSMSTPPESLREYSSAMRARMTVAWAAALKDLKDDGYPSVASRRLDPEFGFDEDPIERHVRQFLSPNTKRREMEAKGLGIQVKVDLDVDMGGDTSMREGHRGDGSRSKDREEVMMDDIDNHAGEDIDVDVAFHPGLIDFGKPAPTGARLSRPPLPSWLSRTSTTTSLEPNTPSSGSTFSDASFEAASKEDYMNMYGRDSDLEMQGRAYVPAGPAGPGPTSISRTKSISGRDRMSIASISTTASTATFGSTITSLSTSTVTAAGPAVPIRPCLGSSPGLAHSPRSRTTTPKSQAPQTTPTRWDPNEAFAAPCARGRLGDGGVARREDCQRDDGRDGGVEMSDWEGNARWKMTRTRAGAGPRWTNTRGRVEPRPEYRKRFKIVRPDLGASTHFYSLPPPKVECQLSIFDNCLLSLLFKHASRTYTR